MKKLLLIISGCCLLAACQKQALSSNKSDANVEIATVSAESSVQNTHTIEVSGKINETPLGVGLNRSDIWTGSLIGNGHVTLISFEVIDPENVINIIGNRRLNTSDGSLLMDEIGEHRNGVVNVISTIKEGTGIYKNANGVLNLTGIHEATGVRLFSYSGTITLVN